MYTFVKLPAILDFRLGWPQPRKDIIGLNANHEHGSRDASD
jgi:hypothetical protein